MRWKLHERNIKRSRESQGNVDLCNGERLSAPWNKANDPPQAQEDRMGAQIIITEVILPDRYIALKMI